MKFVSLHNHTELGSYLDAINDVNEIFDTAKNLDMPALAITEHGNMTSVYDAWKASKRTGVKLIPGMEIYFTEDTSPENKKNYHLVLLAQNEIGYRNLLRVNHESHKHLVSGYMGKKTNRVSWDALQKFSEGVIALTACSNGLVAKYLITEQNEKAAVEHMNRLKSIYQDRFFLELQPHRLFDISKKTGKEVNQTKLNEALVKFSHDLDIPYVITCDSHYKDKEAAKSHDMLISIRDHVSYYAEDRFRYGVEDMYLKHHNEIEDFFGKEIASKGMENTIRITNSCDNPTYIEPKGPIIPKFPIEKQEDYLEFKEWHSKNNPNLEEDKSYLRYKCVSSFKNKFSNFNPEKKKEYWDRTKYELSILEEKNFSSYMLIVSDYINWAKNQGIPVGPGRGSALGALTSYLTGITTVDPLEYSLIFERFQNPEKKSFPDIDTDFAEPEKVKQYLREKYGHDKVASISNWSTLSPKVVIKDVARSLDLGDDKSQTFQIANHITSIMPDTDTIEQAYKESKEFAKYMDKYPLLYKFACELQNLTRNASVHAAGIIIHNGDNPIYENIPVRIDPDTNELIAAFEKTRVEDYGYIKFDLLGLKTLSVMDETFKLIKQQYNQEISMDRIPLDDNETFKMIGQGETSGVFQLESSLTPLCVKIKPNNIQGISDINALGRPSVPAESRNMYIERRLGLKAVEYLHPNLKRSLQKTFGISLYEEGMITIVADCAGWSLAKADNLRKITKLKGKDPDLVLKTEAEFINDSMKFSGMTYKKAKEIWDKEISSFGEYGFNASHSIAYSHISYYTAWLRKHYKTAFFCAMLNSEDPNSDAALEYLAECKRLGIKITPPDISLSKGNYTITGENQISTGLSAIKGVGEKAIDNIIQLQPFTSIEDFFARINARAVNKRVVESLAKSGAFDTMSRTRKDIFENHATYKTKIQNEIKKDAYSIDTILPRVEEEWDRKTLLLYEKESLGRTISGSLHEIFNGFFTRSQNVFPLRKVKTTASGQKVRVELVINSMLKEFKIKKGKMAGKKFAKYSVEDYEGTVSELTIWSHEYEKYGNILNDGVPIKAICKVDDYMDQKSLSLISLEGILGRNL